MREQSNSNSKLLEGHGKDCGLRTAIAESATLDAGTNELGCGATTSACFARIGARPPSLQPWNGGPSTPLNGLPPAEIIAPNHLVPNRHKSFIFVN